MGVLITWPWLIEADQATVMVWPILIDIMEINLIGARISGNAQLTIEHILEQALCALESG